MIVGGLSGAVLGERVSKDLRHRMPMIFGCASMGLGIAMVVKVKFLPVAVLALLLGYILGELLHLETGIEKVAGVIRRMIDKLVTPPQNGLSQEEYMEKFIAILVLFCASGTGVFGSMQEGMTGDPSLLIVKAFLDLFTAGIFAIALGFPVVTLAIPQFIIQTGLFLGAATIIPTTILIDMHQVPEASFFYVIDRHDDYGFGSKRSVQAGSQRFGASSAKRHQ